MLAASTASRRYALSFTTGTLLVREATVVAPLYLDIRDWEQTRDITIERNVLQGRTYRTSVRLAREAVKRLSALVDGEVELLADATASERAHLMWVAACRRYQFIGEFAEEVVRERFLLLASTLGYEEFDSFVRTKALWHEELAAIKDSTLLKLRSNVFKMLQEAELLSETRFILPALLSERVVAKLDARMPSDLRFFPTPRLERRGTSQ
ncbi:putative inner membrane protein (DUF1819) [Promicromonospora umidemergens]|uniref:DUF1819 family protein n=1 Tax=Promicromonospora umidemergens TaxID=629679 RepID=UPI0020A3B4E5|nr:DUF1819 family protein [Promicromonospora umidemergens]MCP2285145.1 putative inner membrane protein (DUF1819) [Promicromonospora umidemergens]